METTGKKGAERSLEEKIIDDLIFGDDPKNVREDIREIIDFYLTQTDDDAKRRESVYNSFYEIAKVLKAAQPLHDKRYPNKE